MGVPSLDRLSGPTSLRDQAYAAIKAAILSLRLKPGSPLVEAALAEQLGISKTPVRDALLQLEKEGLVTTVSFRGSIVSPISQKDMKEIFQLRGVLEGLSVRLGVDILTEEDLKEAEALIQQAEEALERGDYAACNDKGQAFHALLVSKINNRRLTAIMENLDDHLERFRVLIGMIPGRMRKSIEEHRAVLQALKERDGERAEKAMLHHSASFLAEFLSDPTIQSLTTE